MLPLLESVPFAATCHIDELMRITDLRFPHAPTWFLAHGLRAWRTIIPDHPPVRRLDESLAIPERLHVIDFWPVRYRKGDTTVYYWALNHPVLFGPGEVE